MMKIIIFFLFYSGQPFANLICDLKSQSTCTEILDITDEQLVQQVKQICLQNKNELIEGECTNENMVGYCLFNQPLVTKYYAPEYNDYGAEMTCHYSRGRYRRAKK